jgi:hypothetical protein
MRKSEKQERPKPDFFLVSCFPYSLCSAFYEQFQENHQTAIDCFRFSRFERTTQTELQTLHGVDDLPETAKAASILRIWQLTVFMNGWACVLNR